MTDLIAAIFWSFLGILALASLVAMIRMRYGEREKGPWVVTRVGVSGREFYRGERDGEWTTNPKMAHRWLLLDLADDIADQLLADVAPLSLFVEGGK